MSYDTACELVRDRLGDGAFQHSVRVGETAASLAAIYGIDADRARLAGVLHDWDRELDHESLIAAAEASGHPVGMTESAAPRLLHARTGARALAAALPELSEDVVRAVERHTLGAVGMEPLDMVVYVADMVEPGRRYPGVDDLREMAGTVSLDDLFAEAFRHTVSHLVQARKPIHPVTVDVWNAHVARGES